jgi:plastocyanin
MQFSLTLILLPICLGMGVKAANHIVTVGPSGSTVYDPSSVTAAVGDTIEFQFASNVSPVNSETNI